MIIKREERLNIPEYDDFDEIRFFSKNYNLILFYSTSNYFEKGELIIREFGDYIDEDGRTLFKKPDTKENYAEAIILCKKLFLGEEV